MDSQDLYTYQALRCVSEKEQQQIKNIFTNSVGKKRGFTSPSSESATTIKRRQVLDRGGYDSYHSFTSLSNPSHSLTKLQGGIQNGIVK